MTTTTATTSASSGSAILTALNAGSGIDTSSLVSGLVSATYDPKDAALPGVLTTRDQWDKEAIVIPDKLRAEKMAEWRKWFTENIMN